MPTRLFWWLNPAAVMLLLHLPLLAVAYGMPEWSYSQLWRTPKYLDTYTTALSGLMVLVWMLGFALTRRDSKVVAAQDWTMSLVAYSTLRTLFNIAFGLTLMGYVAMVIGAASRGLDIAVLIAAVQGQKNVMPQLKDVYFATIPGLTTLTQFGPAAAIFGALIAGTGGWRSIRARAFVLLALTALRAFFVSERLALLEVLTPAAIVAFRFLPYPAGAGQRMRRTLLTLLPVAAVAGLLVMFGTFEYFRSWTNFYAQEGGDFTTFTSLRAVGYYTTAYNNSAFLYHNFEQTSLIPQFTAEWLWRFPGLNLLLGDGADVVAERSRSYMSLLKSGVIPEFNNSGGLLMPAIDFGVLGGVLFWFVAGVVSRKLFDSYRSLKTTGLLLYPICLMGLLEASRLIYWTSGRVFPTLVMLVVGTVMLNRERRSNLVPVWSVSPAR